MKKTTDKILDIVLIIFMFFAILVTLLLYCISAMIFGLMFVIGMYFMTWGFLGLIILPFTLFANKEVGHGTNR